MLTIVLCKWTPLKNQLHSIPNQAVTTYTYEHINIQYDMLRRNLSVPFRTILFTDEKDARIHPDIIQKDLWTKYKELGGCYLRIFLFSKEMKELVGDRFVHMDLSTIITADITHLLTRVDSDLLIYRNFLLGECKDRMAGGFYVLKSGSRHDVYEAFNNDPQKAMEASRKAYIGTDQSWFNYYLNWRDYPYVDDRDGVYNMLHDIMNPTLTDIPKNAKMIFFSGPRDVFHGNMQQAYPWLANYFRLNTDGENNALAKKQTIPEQTDSQKDIQIYKLELNYQGKPINVHLAEQERAKIFYKGFNARMIQLARFYHLYDIHFHDNDIVIDVGANIGEVGLFLKIQQPNIQYLPIEASFKEAHCCNLNHGAKITLNKAVWKEEGHIDFYNKNDTGDSSIFEMQGAKGKSTIPATTLNKIVKDYNIPSIKLIKIDGEGAEPEILQGASDIFEKIDYLSVDCGPERGWEKADTMKEVVNILTAHNFSIKSINFDRLVILFKNNRLN